MKSLTASQRSAPENATEFRTPRDIMSDTLIVKQAMTPPHSAASRRRASLRQTVVPLRKTLSGSLQLHPRDIRDLLQRRLETICWLTSGAWLTLILYILTSADSLLHPHVLGSGWTVIMSGIVLLLATSGLIIHRSSETTLRRLRVLELLLLGVGASGLGWLRFATLQFAVTETERSGGSLALLFPYAVALSNFLWTVLIVLYGVMIPNTWCRTLRCTACLAAIVVAIDVTIWYQHPFVSDTRFQSTTALTAEMLVVGIGTAVFGSVKIGTLQAEAAVARERERAIGQYHLGRRLGCGGMGEVFLAEHCLLRRPCAIKLIRPERAGDRQTLIRFEREVQATARLAHPNTVEIYDFGLTQDGAFYYVMEYLDGMSLEDLVRRQGPLCAGRALHLAQQLCGALHEAHASGMVHRDIKPGNVFVCRRGGLYDVVKLLDFGLVRTRSVETGNSLEKITLDGHVVGTPDYMSPEQANEPETVDGRSDLYSLGCLFCFMLTGQAPFAGRTVLDTLIAHRQEAVVPLRDLGFNIPDQLQAVISACLQKDPCDRMPDADSLSRALSQCTEVRSWTQDDAAACWS